MSEPVPLFSVRGLEKRFPDTDRGLLGITTDIHSGEFVLLAGGNGSGKTLLVKHLLALEEPTAGSVLFKGEPVKRRLRELRGAAGMVLQHPEHQIIESRVRDDVAFGLRFTRLSEDEIESRVDEALSLLGLESLAEAFTHTLSGGEKRRVALAGMLVLRPEILFFDEPYNELDLEGVRALNGRLHSLKERGTAIVMITHDPEKCSSLADRVFCLERGRLVLDAPPGEAWPRLPGYGVRNPLVPWNG